jgi:hypothetical protein
MILTKFCTIVVQVLRISLNLNSSMGIQGILEVLRGYRFKALRSTSHAYYKSDVNLFLNSVQVIAEATKESIWNLADLDVLVRWNTYNTTSVTDNGIHNMCKCVRISEIQLILLVLWTGAHTRSSTPDAPLPKPSWKDGGHWHIY